MTMAPSSPPLSRQIKTPWGLLWIISSIILPALIGGIVAGVNINPPEFLIWAVPAVVLINHAVASTMICRSNLGLGLLAFICGWILIVGSFFIGCCTTFSS